MLAVWIAVAVVSVRGIWIAYRFYASSLHHINKQYNSITDEIDDH